MFSALLYLYWQTFKNRTVVRFKRLKQPKYLFGGIVGGLYFYFYFFRYLFTGSNGRQGWLAASSPADLLFYESAGAGLFCGLVLLAWVLPHERAALAFSEAEIAFLFPAPISRRGLIHSKLLRSQIAIFFTTLILTLLTNRFGGPAWIRAIGFWLLFSIYSLHQLGSSFARTMLLDRGITNWQRRTAILALAGALSVGVIVWAKRSLPGLDLAQLNSRDAIKDFLNQVFTAGPLPWLLYPFRLAVRPFLATNGLMFLNALGPALLLLLLHYWWVVRSNVAFEEASLEFSRRIAERVAAARAGNWQAARQKLKPRRAPFTLGPAGLPAVAFLWKNLISAGQAFSVRIWITLVSMGIGLGIGFGQMPSGANLSLVLGMSAAGLAAWSLLLGPQLLRQDLRQDLLQVDMLKVYPLPGWQIALGELLAPAAILTAVQWFLLLVALVFFFQVRDASLNKTIIGAVALSAMLVVPLLNLVTLLIPNAAVLLFPAWFLTGKEGPQGIEATGQRIILMFGQLLVFLLALIPAALMFALTFFLSRLVLGPAIAIPLCSLPVCIVLAGEVALGIMLLGRLFERFDVAAETNA